MFSRRKEFFWSRSLHATVTMIHAWRFRSCTSLRPRPEAMWSWWTDMTISKSLSSRAHSMAIPHVADHQVLCKPIILRLLSILGPLHQSSKWICLVLQFLFARDLLEKLRFERTRCPAQLGAHNPSKSTGASPHRRHGRFEKCGAGQKSSKVWITSEIGF